MHETPQLSLLYSVLDDLLAYAGAQEEIALSMHP